MEIRIFWPDMTDVAPSSSMSIFSSACESCNEDILINKYDTRTYNIMRMVVSEEVSTSTF